MGWGGMEMEMAWAFVAPPLILVRDPEVTWSIQFPFLLGYGGIIGVFVIFWM